jgi:hypothetical protein
MGPTFNEVMTTFDHHQPSSGQVERILNIRKAAKQFFIVIWENAPEGADRTCAVRKVHEAMMTANKAIVIETDPRP